MPLLAGAPVAQWIEHQPPELRATGSNPVRRATGKQQGTETTQRFPRRTRLGGPLAQLVEQLTLNQRAVGSTPTRPTTNQRLIAPLVSDGSPCRHSVGSRADLLFFYGLDSELLVHLCTLQNVFTGEKRSGGRTMTKSRCLLLNERPSKMRTRKVAPLHSKATVLAYLASN